MSIVNEYTFGSQTGTSLKDSIGTNNGTLGGSTLPTWGKELDGSKERQYLSFSGGHGGTGGDWQRVDFTRSDFEYTDTDDFTISIGLKVSVANSSYSLPFSLYNNYGSAARGQIAFWILPTTNYVRFQIQTSDASINFIDFSTSIVDSKHHILTGKLDSGVMSFYIDGELIGTKTIIGTGNLFPSDGKAVIGGIWDSGTSNYKYDFSGKIFYFSNFNHALSTAEIKALTEEQLTEINNRPLMNRMDKIIDVAPAAHYPLNGNSNDISGNGNNGTDTSMTYGSKWDDGLDVGEFNGSSSAIDLPDSFQDTTLSYSCWFKTTGTSSQVILSNVTPSTFNDGYWLQTVSTTGVLSAYFWNGGGISSTLSSSVAVNDGNWHHAAVTVISGTTGKLYLDGVLVDSGTIALAYNGSANIPKIGDLVWGGVHYRFSGDIRDTRFYSSALTSDQIKQLYQTYSPPKNEARDSLTNLYLLDSPDGVNDVKDYAGTNNGTKGGTTKPTSIVTPNGVNGLSFSGGHGSTLGDRQRVDFTTSDFQYTATDSFSWSVMFRTTSSVYSYISSIIDEDGSFQGFINIRLNADGTIAGTVTGNNLYKQHKSTVAYNDGEWHMAVLTWSNNTMKFYVDNISYAQSATSGTPSGNLYRTNAKFVLGADYASSTGNYRYDFDGDIAYFANYSKALTTTEIDKLYRDTYIA